MSFWSHIHLFSCCFSTVLKKPVLLDTDLHTSAILQHIALNLRGYLSRKALSKVSLKKSHNCREQNLNKTSHFQATFRSQFPSFRKAKSMVHNPQFKEIKCCEFQPPKSQEMPVKTLILSHVLHTPGSDVQLHSVFPQFPATFSVQDEFNFGNERRIIKQTLV